MHKKQEHELSKSDPIAEPLLVRVEEAARLLSLSRSTIYEMLDAGELASYRRCVAEWLGASRSRPCGHG